MKSAYKQGLLPTPPPDLRCHRLKCKGWRIHNKNYCQLHYFEFLHSTAKKKRKYREECEQVKEEQEEERIPLNLWINYGENFEEKGNFGGTSESSKGNSVLVQKKLEKCDLDVHVGDQEKNDLDVNRFPSLEELNDQEKIESFCVGECDKSQDENVAMEEQTEESRRGLRPRKATRNIFEPYVDFRGLGKANPTKKKRVENKEVKRRTDVAKREVKRNEESTSSMCHQCQRNDRGEVVRCTLCKSKRSCLRCIEKWYPHTSTMEIAESCPVCLGNCNCKDCLRKDIFEENNSSTMDLQEDEKVKYLQYVVQLLAPYMPGIGMPGICMPRMPWMGIPRMGMSRMGMSCKGGACQGGGSWVCFWCWFCLGGCRAFM